MAVGASGAHWLASVGRPRRQRLERDPEMWLLVAILLLLLLFGGGAYVLTSNLLLVIIVVLVVMAVAGYGGRSRWR